MASIYQVRKILGQYPPLPKAEGLWRSASLFFRFLGLPTWSVSIHEDDITVHVRGKTIHTSPISVQYKASVLINTLHFRDDFGIEYNLHKLGDLKGFEEQLSNSKIHYFYKNPGKLFLNLKEWEKKFDRLVLQGEKTGWICLDESDKNSLNLTLAHHFNGLDVYLNTIFHEVTCQINYTELQNFSEWVDKRNEQNLRSWLWSDKEFFDTVVKRPLTEEQRNAVVCFAPRCMVIASAGSGKSTVSVAKTAYAIKKKFFSPSEILLLTFNRNGALDLNSMVKRTLKKFPDPKKENVKVSTFHAFALNVIGEVTGKKPDIPEYVQKGREIEELGKLFSLQMMDPAYEKKFRLFQSLGALRNFEQSEQVEGLKTSLGEKVKSKAELSFANWLYHSGIAYEYEKKYPFPTADEHHRQYCPDFYLPQLNAWVEVWALRDGVPDTPQFPGYQASKNWKRLTHKKNHTCLLEINCEDVNVKGLESFGNLLLRKGLTCLDRTDKVFDKFQTQKKEKVSNKAVLGYANWLAWHGIRYEYRKKYPLSQSPKKTEEYRPDFYLPDFDAWVHIWLLKDGEKETLEYAGYQASKKLKRQIHSKNRTTLIEINASDVTPNKLDELSSALLKQGLKTSILSAFRKFSGFQTLNKETVDTTAELGFANWLHLSGITYEFKKAYPYARLDGNAYRPSFYLPDTDTWIEILLLRPGEEESPGLCGYNKKLLQKRRIHEENGTRLLEIFAEDVTKQGLLRFEKILTRLGVTFNDALSCDAISYMDGEKDFLQFLRVFQTHAHNNNFSIEDIRKKSKEKAIRNYFRDEDRYREELFLDLYEPIEKSWVERLKQNNEVDFEMMLLKAAEVINAGKWKNPFRFIMVDEFQDTSQARAEILKAMLKTKGTRLFVVGDDWQSINRFAGADVSLMYGFDRNFGEKRTLTLSKTFRCSKEICRVSGKFISRNPKQIKKEVNPFSDENEKSVRIIQIEKSSDIAKTVMDELIRLEQLPLLDPKRKRTVALLGRYRKDLQYLPRKQLFKNLEINFFTVHASKGLEYDHVILVRLDEDFPSKRSEDPLLSLVMPETEGFPYAEERRLLYVALTRARHSVAVVAPMDSKSEFLSELKKDLKVWEKNLIKNFCPCCGRPLIERKNRATGKIFYGCKGFPACHYTEPMPEKETPAQN